MATDSKTPPLIHTIELIDGRRVAVQLIVNPRARSISVRIDPARRIAVATAPSQRQLKRAAAFADERAGWIARELSALPSGAAFAPHALAPLRGVMHELIFEQGRGAARVDEPSDEGASPRIIVPAPEMELFENRVRRFYKAEAVRDLTERVRAHTAVLGVREARLQVKEVRSRWGSCSTDKALAFSWRVVCAPPFVLDYLAAHECAHLVEMNHSARFWRLVARLCPSYELGKAWLHRNGALLMRVGEP